MVKYHHQEYMRKLAWLKDKNLLRILFVYALVCYLPWVGGFSAAPKGKAETKRAADFTSGMGGGALPVESSGVFIEEDPELLGIPEPKEYSKPHLLTFTSYKVEPGDVISNIAIKTGLNSDTLFSVNEVKNARILQIGQLLKIPNQDGIYYTVKKGDTLLSVAQKYKVDSEAVKIANELFSDTIYANARLFLPGARMDWVEQQEINGDLFIWPVSGYITSPYGYRANPFGGARQFHSGLDIGAAMGTPIKAAMAGRVSTVGYDKSFGNYVVISHHSGYRTLYAHMSMVRVKSGAYVAAGQRIGDAGTSGLSTGPHLHFTVYKNGVTVNPRSLMK
jgi:murein DD-endopeptidase MepM/ murein hydrolase activator NlpD